MSDRMDYHHETQRYQRMPRYQLDDGDASAWRIWALVALIAGGVLVLVLASGYGPTAVEHPGGATGVAAPAASDGGTAAGDAGAATAPMPQSIMAPDGQ